MKLFIDIDPYTRPVLVFIVTCLTVVNCLGPVFAIPSDEDMTSKAPKEPIVVNGDNVEYFPDKKMVTGAGNISIKYKDIELTCGKITVYLDTREAIAEENVRVTQKGSYFTGERMNYNFETKKGVVLKGQVVSEPYYGRAEQIDKDKVKNKDRAKLAEGYVTTCDLENPHYRVRAREVMVYFGDKVVAKHIFVYVKNVPVFYFPYYVQPLKEKKSHITVMPGHRKEWGYYALTSYRYYIDDDNKGDILLDYRTKKGLAEGVNHYYDTKEVGKGAVKFYYTRENDMLAYEKTGAVRNRYRWQIRHEWEMPEETGTNFLLEFNKMSDRNVSKDYFYNEYEEMGAVPDNYLTFITQRKGYSSQFLMRKRFDNFLDVIERLPDYSITIPDNNIFKNTPFYYSARASGAYLNHTFDNTNTATPQKDLGSGRVDAYNRLSYLIKFFRTLSISPYAAVEDTYYSNLANGNRNEVRNIFSYGIDSSVKFYKIYDVTTNFLGLDINKLRHVITPTAKYYYVNAPSIASDRIIHFDSIDAVSRTNGVSLGIENRLQTKRMDEEGNMKSVDLATFYVNTDYTIIFKKGGFDTKYDKFSPILFKLELIPYSWAYLQAAMSVDTKRYWAESESIDLVAHWKELWSLAISNRYERVESGTNSIISLDGTWKINEKWKVRAYERFNCVNNAFQEMEYTVTRDLHCWLAELTYRVQDNGDQGLWFVMKLKAFPETPIGLRQTYSRPRFGEAGAH